MKTIVCPNCDSTTEVVKGLTACAKCGMDVRRLVAQAKQLAPSTDDDSDINFDNLEIEWEEDAEEKDSLDFEIQTTPAPSSPKDKTLLTPTLNAGSGEDPMKTLAAPVSDEPFDKTVRADAQSLPNASPPLGENSDSTLIVPKKEPEKTIINASAAQEAAETYSKGLNTVIPPRAISRNETIGQIQDYKLEKRLGAGAFGIVFRATQVPLERSVAVKVLQDAGNVSEARRLKLRAEFLQEAQFTGRLEHPNIVPIHDIGLTVSENGIANPFYVMKEIRGVAWLDSIRSKSRRENLKIFKNVVNAIGFAHDRHIVHCDLKPDNVMVGEFGEVLVVDWGQAIDLSDPETIRPGGTPAYISPEMAQYWCDIHLDGLDDSRARKSVGFRSDVYLLGAVLFEIVSGSPPHVGKDEDSAYQIIRFAAQNEIADHEAHVNDELMQIALACMRVGNRKPLETVADLSIAIRDYEDRLSSIELRQRAYEVLAEAKSNSDYDEFQKARFGFEESLEKWDGNERSKQGLRDAQLSCAELALKDQNFDLGIGMLENGESREETSLKAKLVAGKTKRDRRQKLVRYLALGLASSIIVGIGLNAFMINENFKSLGLRDEAVAEKRSADEAKELAVNEMIEANSAKLEAEEAVLPLRNEIAQFPKQLEQAEENYNSQLVAVQANSERMISAEKNKLAVKLTEERSKAETKLAGVQKAFDSQLKEEKAKLDTQLAAETKQLDLQLAEAKENFNQETKQLVTQKEMLVDQVTELNESSRLLRYKGDVTNVVQKLQAGDYRDSRSLVDAFGDNTNWEVERLNLLAHREVEAIYPQDTLVSLAASADGTTFGLLYPDRVDVHKTKSFGQSILSIRTNNATAIAFSNDGKTLAIGSPAQSELKAGKIQILDIANPDAARNIKTLLAQSRTISKMDFNERTGHFLSVGLPSKLRKSSNIGEEKELMIWNQSWSPIKVELILGNGEHPKFTSAEFSRDGNRILTTSPSAQIRDQVVHVFENQSERFRWATSSLTAGINVATFENDEGTAIVGCAFDSDSKSFSLASWQLDRNSQRQFIKTSLQQGQTLARGLADGRELRNVAQLAAKALSITRYENQLVTTGLDHRSTIWDWQTKTPNAYKGHSRAVDFGFLLPATAFNKHVLVSASSGDSAEILKTDLAKFNQEIQTGVAGRVSNSDRPSPSTIYKSRVSGQLALGNDFGQASVNRDNNSIQWEVTAWKNHVLSDDFLFAQSRADYFYKFNRKTGALDGVLTNIAFAFEDEVVKFEVSRKGDIALIVTNDNRPQFHVWDLINDRKIRTVNYGAEDIFETGTEKTLQALTLSPDGRWIIGGKVGVFAWSTQSGKGRQLTTPGPEMARGAISAIEFVDDGTRFLASWKNRIDLFDLTKNSAPIRFTPESVSYSKNEPNIFGTRQTGNKIQVLARSISTTQQGSGVILFDLESNSKIAQFDDARFVSFSNDDSGDVVIVNKSTNQQKPILQVWKANTRTFEDVEVDRALAARFNNRFSVIEKAFSHNGRLTLQTSTKNGNSSTRRDWNTLSINPDLTPGPIRVIAKPMLKYHATAGDRSITFENGSIRFWKLSKNSVQPDGILAGDFRCCALSPDEKVLAATLFDSNTVLLFDPQTGERFRAVDSVVDSTIESIAWSAASNQIAMGFKSGSIEVIELVGLDEGQPKSSGELSIADGTIDELAFSKDSNSLLAISAQAGVAFVLHPQEGQWKRVAIGHVDGQKIATGDIADSGNRVVTGSSDGRLTLWNTEASQTSTQNDASELLEERELYSLSNQHQSKIQFARFLPGADGSAEIVSSEVDSGENEYLIWKTQPIKK